MDQNTDLPKNADPKNTPAQPSQPLEANLNVNLGSSQAPPNQPRPQNQFQRPHIGQQPAPLSQDGRQFQASSPMAPQPIPPPVQAQQQFSQPPIGMPPLQNGQPGRISAPPAMPPNGKSKKGLFIAIALGLIALTAIAFSLWYFVFADNDTAGTLPDNWGSLSVEEKIALNPDKCPNPNLIGFDDGGCLNPDSPIIQITDDLKMDCQPSDTWRNTIEDEELRGRMKGPAFTCDWEESNYDLIPKDDFYTLINTTFDEIRGACRIGGKNQSIVEQGLTAVLVMAIEVDELIFTTKNIEDVRDLTGALSDGDFEPQTPDIRLCDENQAGGNEDAGTIEVPQNEDTESAAESFPNGFSSQLLVDLGFDSCQTSPDDGRDYVFDYACSDSLQRTIAVWPLADADQNSFSRNGIVVGDYIYNATPGVRHDLHRDYFIDKLEENNIDHRLLSDE